MFSFFHFLPFSFQLFLCFSSLCLSLFWASAKILSNYPFKVTTSSRGFSFWGDLLVLGVCRASIVLSSIINLVLERGTVPLVDWKQFAGWILEWLSSHKKNEMILRFFPMRVTVFEVLVYFVCFIKHLVYFLYCRFQFILDNPFFIAIFQVPIETTFRLSF